MIMNNNTTMVDPSVLCSQCGMSLVDCLCNLTINNRYYEEKI